MNYLRKPETFNDSELKKTYDKDGFLDYFALMLASSLEDKKNYPFSDQILTAISATQGRRTGRDLSFFEAIEQLRGNDSDEYKYIKKIYDNLINTLMITDREHPHLNLLTSENSAAMHGQELSGFYQKHTRTLPNKR